jgi:flagellar secretion chaperone FliS
MKNANVLAYYQKTHVETSGKLDLVIMCYEKALQFLHEAKNFLRAKEYEKKGRAMKKVLDIIYELQSSLNFEKGDEIAKNLRAIYSYLIRRLHEGDLQKDLTAFDEGIQILSELKDAWVTIASNDGNGLTSELITPSPARNEARIAAAV